MRLLEYQGHAFFWSFILAVGVNKELCPAKHPLLWWTALSLAQRQWGLSECELTCPILMQNKPFIYVSWLIAGIQLQYCKTDEHTFFCLLWETFIKGQLRADRYSRESSHGSWLVSTEFSSSISRAFSLSLSVHYCKFFGLRVLWLDIFPFTLNFSGTETIYFKVIRTTTLPPS